MTEQELAELEVRYQSQGTLAFRPSTFPRLAAALREAWKNGHLLIDKVCQLTAERDALRAAIRTALAAYHTDPNAFVKAMDELAKLEEK